VAVRNVSETDEFSLHAIVSDDARAAYEDLASDGSQRKRRVYVRAALAAIEALTHVLKQAALEQAAADPGRFLNGETAMLREETYSLDNKGGVASGMRVIPPPENFRFALAMVMKATLPGFSMVIQPADWEALKVATAVRNRLTHPRATSEMTVTDKEVALVHQAFVWVNASAVRGLSQAVEVLLRESAQPIPARLDEIRRRWGVPATKDEHDG
jgi:hypothetical protein